MTASPRNRRLLAAAALIAVLGLALLALPGGRLLLSSLDLRSAEFSVPGNGTPAVPADSAPVARALVDLCGERRGQARTECYEEGLTSELERAGVRPTMITLEYLVRLDAEVARDAHVYAHHVGIQAYQRSPDVSATFSGCTESFSSGCYHGVIQAYFEERGTADPEVVRALCEPYKSGEQSRWTLFQCIHGMGHGLTMYYDHHLPRALEACDLLTDNWDRQSCYGGAFMENVMGATAPHHPATVLAASEAPGDASTEVSPNTSGEPSDLAAAGGHSHPRDAPEDSAAPSGREGWKPLDPADPLYPCSVLDERYLRQCYLMQTSVMLYLNGNDLADASRSCDLAPPDMRPTCHQSVGRSVTARTKDPRKAAGHCRAGSEAYRGWCYVGVVKAFVDWTASAESGLAFCRVVDDPGHKAMCYRGLGEEIAHLVADDETRAALCGEAEEEFRPHCRRGARLGS